MDRTTAQQKEPSNIYEAKRKQQREINRLAAERFRKRRADVQRDLIKIVHVLESKRKLLQNELISHKAHKSNLVLILSEHRTSCRLSKEKCISLSSDSLEAKRISQREMNRLAAERYRKRRADQLNDLITEVSVLAEKNQHLHNELSVLWANKSQLIFMLCEHRAYCPHWIPVLKNAPSIEVSPN